LITALATARSVGIPTLTSLGVEKGHFFRSFNVVMDPSVLLVRVKTTVFGSPGVDFICMMTRCVAMTS
jgi:hypothetical protein